MAAGDARAAGHDHLNAILIEVSDPRHASAGRDAIDAAARVMMWRHWGYQRLVFPYRQPALSPAQSPVDDLLLAVKVFDDDLRARFPSTFAQQLVMDYLVWANRFVASVDDPYILEMSAFAAAHPVVELKSLAPDS